MNEIQRQSNQREKILQTLRDHKETGITNLELSYVSLRYGGHLGALYQKGFKISKESLGNGLYLYKLLEEPSEDYQGKMKAYDVLKEALKSTCSLDEDKFEKMMDELGLSVRYKAGTYN